MVVERLVPGTDEWLLWNPEHVSRYVFASQFVKNKTVLDAGCGPGYGSAILMYAKANRVQAVDLLEDVVIQARHKYQSSGIDFIVDNCETLTKTKGPFDVICSFENIEHLNNPTLFLKNAAANLAPTGVLLCSTPDRKCMPPFVNGRPSNPFHTIEWYRSEFLAILKEYFLEIEMYVQVRGLSLIQRTRAVNAATEHLDRIMNNRITRTIAAILGRVGYHLPRFGSILGLAAGSPQDYPIVHESLESCFGEAVCHYAICRRPRHTSAI